MAKFAVLVHGVNFMIRDEPCGGPHGFYVTAFVECDTADIAELEGVDLVRGSLRQKITLMNLPGDPPRLLVDEIGELTDWPECLRPLSGFAFYNEGDDEEE